MYFGTQAQERTPLLPLSNAHQEGLKATLSQLQASGYELDALSQLIEQLPRLRAGLAPAERQRIDELDNNQGPLCAAFQASQTAITALDALTGDPEQPMPLHSLLLNPALLRQIAAAATSLAEAVNELALRAATRAAILE